MSSSTQAGGRYARGATLIITFSAKITAIIVVVNETLLEREIRPTAMAAAMVFFAGAEATERAALRLFEKLLSDVKGDPPTPAPAETKT